MRHRSAVPNNPFGTSNTADLISQLESRSFTGFNLFFYEDVSPRPSIHTGMNDTIGEMIEYVTGQPFDEFNNNNGGVFNPALLDYLDENLSISADDVFAAASALKLSIAPPMEESPTATATALAPGMNSSVIEISFPEAVAFAGPKEDFLSTLSITAQAENPAWQQGSTAEPQFVEVIINATDASIFEDGRTLSITTDLLTPADAEVVIAAGTLQSDGEPLEVTTIKIQESDITPVEFLLAYRGDTGFWITDPNVVTYHPDSPPLADRSAAREADPNGYGEFDQFMGIKLERGIISQKEYDALQAILRGPGNVEFIATAEFTAEEMSLSA